MVSEVGFGGASAGNLYRETSDAEAAAALAAAPFNSGLLAQPWPLDDAHFNYGPAGPAVLDRSRELARICTEHGVQPHGSRIRS
jgi:D-threo-aldose 1-dehydrogenase